MVFETVKKHVNAAYTALAVLSAGVCIPITLAYTVERVVYLASLGNVNLDVFQYVPGGNVTYMISFAGLVACTVPKVASMQIDEHKIELAARRNLSKDSQKELSDKL